ncbi:MAG: hypothetical protein L3K10_07140 [Thermoplasmata archaeon]|nr:hypothetical protein [Thermoplasmata archaeon]
MSRGSARSTPRSVGTVLAVTPAGNFTVRASGPDVTPERSRVADDRGDVRGVVVRVFGPVARPYYSVRPRRALTPAEGMRVLGATLWAE